MVYRVLFFLFLSISIFSQGLQDKNQRIEAIDREIEMLMQKKRVLKI